MQDVTQSSHIDDQLYKVKLPSSRQLISLNIEIGRGSEKADNKEMDEK